MTLDYGSLTYMSEQKACYLRSLIKEHKIRDVLELGFFHGKVAPILQLFWRIKERPFNHD